MARLPQSRERGPEWGAPEPLELVSRPELSFNGINGTVGGPYYPCCQPPGLAPAPETSQLPMVANPPSARPRSLGRAQERPATAGPYALDYRDLAQTGWGVIFAPGLDPAVRDALEPLLALRREQASRLDPLYYREISSEIVPGRDGSTLDFFLRCRVSPAWVDPANLPYYLLLVGDPEHLSFGFQHELDSQFAVGRLDLESPESYAAYAESVVRAERRRLRRPLRATFFGTENADDSAMDATSQALVRPLAAATAAACAGLDLRLVRGPEATKARLATLLGGAETPDFLFTASHGVGFHADDPRQRDHQGALLCQDWPGPEQWPWPTVEDHYFAGQDLASEARLDGLIAFLFACHSAGTPQWDHFPRGLGGESNQLAAAAFVARLPQRLLGHPRGGALAVIGHVERTWGYSFLWNGCIGQPGPFHEATERLLQGCPVGYAMEPFAHRFLTLQDWLVGELGVLERGELAGEGDFAWLWTATHDARSYVILGDPAVHLPVVAEADAAAVD